MFTNRFVLVVFALGLSILPPLHAQKITVACIGALAPDCKANVGPADGLQQAMIEVRVKRGEANAAGAMVTFAATSGIVHSDTVFADSDGIARTRWLRSKGSDAVGIAIEATLGRSPGNASQLAFATLTAVDPPKSSLQLLKAGGFRQSWFQKSQTPRPIRVELKAGPGAPTLDSASCVGNRVAFKLRGAPQTVSPDTASGVLEEDGRCFAETFWTMGDGIGERQVDVTLAPGRAFTANSLMAEGWTRATPRFIGGFGAGRLRGYRTVNPAAQRLVRVERIDAAGTKHSFDTTETTGQPALKDVKSTTAYSAVAALSLPIPLAVLGRFDNLSFTVGVDISKPTERQYYGFSALQLLGAWIPVIEALPIDLHVLRFYARQPQLVDPQCELADCTTRERIRSQRWAFMLSADATQLIADVVKKLNP